jgi:PilZ domain-containing protein
MVALMKMPASLPTDSWAERRMFPRKEFHATVQGNRMDHTLEARQMPRLSLMLRDLSLGGLSAICDRPLKQGEHLAVFFPKEGMMRGWDAFGRVLRCDPSGLGYRVAVEFDSLPAA